MCVGKTLIILPERIIIFKIFRRFEVAELSYVMVLSICQDQGFLAHFTRTNLIVCWCVYWSHGVEQIQDVSISKVTKDCLHKMAITGSWFVLFEIEDASNYWFIASHHSKNIHHRYCICLHCIDAYILKNVCYLVTWSVEVIGEPVSLNRL